MACWSGQRQNDMNKDADICRTQWEKLGSWFIGPSAENIDEFCELAIETIKRNGKQQNYFPDDKTYIPAEIKSSKIYKAEMAKLKTELKSLNDALTESIPLASIRYQGHMVSDTILSARLGFLSAWMTNANNVATEVGLVTTQLEIEVGKQLCDLFGFELTNDPRGYITTGGSSANIEALWASRNVKFFPLAVQNAIKNEAELAGEKELSVYIPRLDRKQKILSTSTWDLLNLNLDDVIALHQEIDLLTKNDDIDFAHINKYSLTYNGFVQFFKLHNLTREPVVIASAASHLSWEKAATLLGIGNHHLVCIPFDNKTRMDAVALQKILEECLAKMVPVIAVVCVIGTTEHGAVDPVDAMLNLQAEYRTKNTTGVSLAGEKGPLEITEGLNFYLLADAAWGGYYTTIIRNPPEDDQLLPPFPINDYVRKQLSCLKDVDTVTVDPHKSGYCPYPAGGLCYRNGKMKLSLAFSTDMLQSASYLNTNCFGLEASKPGAASAGVYLAHRVIGLHSSGYGRILGQSVFGAKLFYCAWLTVAKPDDNFVCIPLIPLDEAYEEDLAKQFIRDRILGKSYGDLSLDTEVMHFLSKIGPDLPINAFAVNVKDNTHADRCNRLNLAVLNILSHTDSKISTESDDVLIFLKNTVMNPWTAADDTIQMLLQEFRNVVTQCITEVRDILMSYFVLVTCLKEYEPRWKAFPLRDTMQERTICRMN
ncbi:L-tyrosine decarboxylase-like [Pecten maximus]|uniref:L-tyrosine decarboxylase-like n=1 Tax=Pecten maximus TaxID=6579 RepID=UPI001458FAE5|nr:L-tyrosine decarboxylase-like [Pecten maximus]